LNLGHDFNIQNLESLDILSEINNQMIPHHGFVQVVRLGRIAPSKPEDHQTLFSIERSGAMLQYLKE
jgi:hypothetical protein